jgi:hypothetical protein
VSRTTVERWDHERNDREENSVITFIPPDLRIRIPKSEHREIYKWENESNISDEEMDIPFAPRYWTTDAGNF